MAFRDQVSDRQTVAAVASGDLSDQPQMANDKPVGSVAVAVLTPALGQQVFFPPVQHREPLDLLEMTVDAGFGRKHRPGDGAGHTWRPPISFETHLSRYGELSRLFRYALLLAPLLGVHVIARNGRTAAVRGAACASRRLRGRTQPRPMDGAPFFCPRQLVLSDPVGVRRFSSNDPWHRIASHQDARGRWVFGSAAIPG